MVMVIHVPHMRFSFVLCTCIYEDLLAFTEELVNPICGVKFQLRFRFI